MTQRDTAAELLRRHGRTYADEAGITLRDKPSPLFQLLVLVTLFSAPIKASVAAKSARELFHAGWRTPARMRSSTWQQRVDALGRGGYRRYDESTARYLAATGKLTIELYGGDLRLLHRASGDDSDQIETLLREFPRIGSTGATIFCREVQAVWPGLRPFFDDRALSGARKADLPADGARLARLVAPADTARFAAALVRLDLA
jgi:hypothetical protein